MAVIHHLSCHHPLLGVWRSDEDDARSEYAVTTDGSAINVTGHDYLDGEQYEISNVVVDKDAITFDTFMASTGRRGRLRLKSLTPTSAEMTFTFVDVTRAIKVSG